MQIFFFSTGQPLIQQLEWLHTNYCSKETLTNRYHPWWMSHIIKKNSYLEKLVQNNDDQREQKEHNNQPSRKMHRILRDIRKCNTREKKSNQWHKTIQKRVKERINDNHKEKKEECYQGLFKPATFDVPNDPGNKKDEDNKDDILNQTSKISMLRHLMCNRGIFAFFSIQCNQIMHGKKTIYLNPNIQSCKVYIRIVG